MRHGLQDLRTSLGDVRGRVATCARECGRAPEEITLVAVTKTHPVEILQDALSLGVTDFGENRIQEADAKIVELGRTAARWHLIGHLQKNKAHRAVKLFDIIHSLDSVSLAHRLDRFCMEERRAELPVLIQLDLAGEKTKSGVAEDQLPELIKGISECAILRLIGLMTLPPFFDDRESVRPYFRRLREIRDELHDKGHFGDKRGELSMGMSHDFEVAIEEGATMLRIGTAIFGDRHEGASQD